jgi:hypothetical protein
MQVPQTLQLWLARQLLSKSLSAASSASEAFGNTPTNPQKSVLEQRVVVLDAARAFVATAQKAVDVAGLNEPNTDTIHSQGSD